MWVVLVTHDLVVRDGYVRERDATVDLAVEDGRIAAVGDVGAAGEREIDADGGFVSPGLVDCHLHVDKAFAAAGGRYPAGNDEPFEFGRIHEHERDYYGEADRELIRRNAIRDVEAAVAAGSTYLRSHVTVDTGTRGETTVRAAAAAREATRPLADLQLVPACPDDATDEGHALLETALRVAGAGEAGPAAPALVGGSDPASRYDDVEGVLGRWFDLAERHGIGLDLHLHDGGTLGAYTLERLIETAADRGLDGRVTASHAYGLAHVPDWRVDELVTAAERVDLALVTCYQSTRTTMPVETLLDRPVRFGHGTDNDRDFVFPHGNADSVEGALILLHKLHGDRTVEADYRPLETNDGLDRLWDLLTYDGAEVLGIEDGYGLAPGDRADLVVFDSPSPAWAIFDAEAPRAVIKRGRLVATGGAVREAVSPLAHTSPER